MENLIENIIQVIHGCDRKTDFLIENIVKDSKQNTFPFLQTVQHSVLHHNATEINVKYILTLSFRFLMRGKYIKAIVG